MSLLEAAPVTLLPGKLDPAQAERRGCQLRERLLAQLEQAPAGAPRLLLAPAGYGKTVLLGQYQQRLAARGATLAWLTCDEADGAPLRLLQHLLVALSDALPALKRSVALGQQGERDAAERLLALILKELEGLSEPLHLFVDDLHCLQGSAGANLAMQFLERLPNRVQLYLASRRRSSVLEQHPRCARALRLEATALAFDIDEFRLYCEQQGLHAEAGQLPAWHLRTSGWPAALQLLSQHRARGVAPERALEALEEGCRDWAEFLDEELLSGHSDAQLALLERSSGLEDFCAALCDSLGGTQDAQRRLQRLADAQLLHPSKARAAGWFRYPPLLARHLQRRAARHDDPRRLALLAARWYDQQGEGELAVRQALLGEDYLFAEQLLQRHAHRLVGDNRVYGVLGLLERIPPVEIAERPVLRLFHAWRLAMDDRYAEAEALSEALIRDLAAGQLPGAQRELFGVAQVLKALVLLYQDKLEACLQVCRQWLQMIPEAQALLHASLGCVQAAAHGLLGEYTRALDSLQRVRGSLARVPSAYLESLCVLIEALVRKEFGELEPASRQLQQAREQQASDARIELPLRVAQLDLEYERDRHAALLPSLQQALAQRDSAAPLELLGRAQLLQVRGSFFAGGDASQALQQLDHWLRQLQVSGAERIYALGMGCKVQLLLWQARGAEAERTALQLTAQLQGLEAQRYPDAFAALALAQARVALQARRLEQVQAVLEDALEALQAVAGFDRRVRLQALLAVALWRRGQSGRALELWGDVLESAWSRGYRRVFLDDALWLLPLHRAWLGEGRAADWHQLRVQMEDQCRLLGVDPAQLDQDQSISQREQEILRYVAAGLANREIAGDLHLSEATVKWHLHRLFAKLGVRSRTQAVIEGKRRGLLAN